MSTSMKAMTIIGLTALVMGAGVWARREEHRRRAGHMRAAEIKPINRFTIQAAVNAASATDVVLVCPGQYPEQVLIEKSITVKGTADPSGGNLAVITRPVAAGGGYQLRPLSSRACTTETFRTTIRNRWSRLKC